MWRTEEKKNQTSCIFSMSFKELSHQRCKATLLLHSLISSCLCSHMHLSSPALGQTSMLLFLPFTLSPLFEWFCVFSSQLNHILRCHCTKNSLNPSSLSHSLPTLPLCLAVSKTLCNNTVYSQVTRHGRLFWVMLRVLG